MTIKFSDSIIELLTCPVCGEKMCVDGNSLVCHGAKKHCFDISSAGYVNLAPRHPMGGDSKQAVTARNSFLRAGFYRPAAEKIIDTVKNYLPVGSVIIDAGCGEGYYSNLTAEHGYHVCGFDLSKYAVERAAKSAVAGTCTGYAVASVFEMPVRDGCADAVMSIFAPCAPLEFARVLKPGGLLIVAGAGAEHLLGMKKILYDNPYLNTDRADMPDNMERICDIHARFDITVPRDYIDALFSMTPYYWRTSEADRLKLSETDVLDTVVDFKVTVYKNNI